MVDRKAVTLRTLSPAELVVELEQLRPAGQAAVLCFDGDGTLWSGDVGEDLFEFVLQHELLREPAREALEAEATKYGIVPRPTPARTARALYDGYLDGRYPERETYAMMTWCYAGFTLSELRELSRQALSAARLSERLNRELEPIVEWARERDVRATVISASPRFAVEEAASLWGFSPADIMASTPRLEGDSVLPALLHAVPYAESKVTCGRRLFGEILWLSSFGDNIFDLDMLLAAKLGVAVRPKPPLRTRLAELPDLVLLA